MLKSILVLISNLPESEDCNTLLRFFCSLLQTTTSDHSYFDSWKKHPTRGFNQISPLLLLLSWAHFRKLTLLTYIQRRHPKTQTQNQWSDTTRLDNNGQCCCLSVCRPLYQLAHLFKRKVKSGRAENRKCISCNWSTFTLVNFLLRPPIFPSTIHSLNVLLKIYVIPRYMVSQCLWFAPANLFFF